jgi:DNA-binding protein YbaB
VMSQAREMQAQMEQKMAATIVEAETGGGMVQVRMNGKKEVLHLRSSPPRWAPPPAISNCSKT